MEDELKQKAAREHRIARRRLRVQERIESQRKGAHVDDTGHAVVEQQGLGRGAQQVAESRRSLQAIVDRAQRNVSYLRTQAHQRTATRREQEEGNRQAMRERLLSGAEASRAVQAAVDSGWASLQAVGTPQELHAALQRQQAACDAVLRCKDGVVAAMRDALAAKEGEYVRTLQGHAEAVDDMLARKASEASAVQQAYDEELGRIDRAFEEEQREQLAQCRAALAALLDDRTEAEQAATDAYCASLDAYQQQLDATHSADMDAFHALRTRLDLEMQGAEARLAGLRAAELLAGDKLDYDVRVLGTRVAEDAAATLAQKRRLAKLRDALSGLKRRYEEAEVRRGTENQRLTQDFQRTAAAFSNLQAKYARYQGSSLSRYQEIREMKEEEQQGMRARLRQMQHVIMLLICQRRQAGIIAADGAHSRLLLQAPPCDGQPETELAAPATSQLPDFGQWEKLERQLRAYLELLQQRSSMLHQVMQACEDEATLRTMLDSAVSSSSVLDLRLPPTLLL